MKHKDRYDLPKGHREEGETEEECAMRELKEETGLSANLIELDDNFRYEVIYYPKYKRFKGETVKKTVTFFMGWLKSETDIKTTEHKSYEWITWLPPHKIQENTVDPLLAHAEQHLAR